MKFPRTFSFSNWSRDCSWLYMHLVEIMILTSSPVKVWLENIGFLFIFLWSIDLFGNFRHAVWCINRFHFSFLLAFIQQDDTIYESTWVLLESFTLMWTSATQFLWSVWTERIVTLRIWWGFRHGDRIRNAETAIWTTVNFLGTGIAIFKCITRYEVNNVSYYVLEPFEGLSHSLHRYRTKPNS